jgi:DNA invertase Pin-like site-specific DNA recombinase
LWIAQFAKIIKGLCLSPVRHKAQPLSLTTLAHCVFWRSRQESDSVFANKRSKEMENAVIYARYSSQGQNEQTIDGQLRICKQFAESKGFNVVKVYIDKARTGTNDNRPDFQKMIADADNGAFQYILVYKFDRFARNRIDSIMYKAQLKKQNNIRVISATEPVSDDEGGEIYEMFLEWNDEKYSQRLSKRIRDGLITSLENGTYTGTVLLYGYKFIDTDRQGKKGTIHKVGINDEQAKIVRFVFEEYAKGTDKKRIAELLNEQGRRLKSNKFKGRDFDHWLVNTKYNGWFMRFDRKWDNIYPQIIDDLLFAKVQKRLDENKILAGANSAIEPYYLTGKLFCGECDTAMVSGGATSHTGKKYYYYECKGKKKKKCDKKLENKDDLEKKVTLYVIEFLNDKAKMEIACEDSINFYNQRTGDDGLKGIETRIAQTNKEIEEMTCSFISARNDLLKLKIEKRMDEMEIYLNDLLMQQAQIKLERGLKITKEKILSFVSELTKGDPNDKEYQKQLIDRLVYQVFVYDDKYKTIVCYLNFRVSDTEKIRISLNETTETIDNAMALRVQTQSPTLHQNCLNRTSLFGWFDCYNRLLSRQH